MKHCVENTDVTTHNSDQAQTPSLFDTATLKLKLNLVVILPKQHPLRKMSHDSTLGK